MPVRAPGRPLGADHLECPYEEETFVLLLDAQLRVVAERCFGLPLGFFLMRGATPVDARTVDLAFGGGEVWQVTVHDEERGARTSLLARQLEPHQGPARSGRLDAGGS